MPTGVVLQLTYRTERGSAGSNGIKRRDLEVDPAIPRSLLLIPAKQILAGCR